MSGAGNALQGSFQAWFDDAPTSSKSLLYVAGDILYPTSGFTATLEEVEPQGFNPNILILRVVDTPPNSIATQVQTTVAVTFRKSTTARYTDVMITQAGPDFTVPIRTIRNVSLLPSNAWGVGDFDATADRTSLVVIWITGAAPQYRGVYTRGVVTISEAADMSNPVRNIDIGLYYSDVHILKVDNLSPGTTYFLRVMAEEFFGAKVNSNVLRKQTKP